MSESVRVAGWMWFVLISLARERIARKVNSTGSRVCLVRTNCVEQLLVYVVTARFVRDASRCISDCPGLVLGVRGMLGACSSHYGGAGGSDGPAVAGLATCRHSAAAGSLWTTTSSVVFRDVGRYDARESLLRN